MDKTSSKKLDQWIFCVLALQVVANISIIFNVPVARQVIGFVYLVFVPGFALIKLLKMKVNGLAETLLFATGLSIASLMLIGLFVNQLNPLFGFLRPLSLMSLLPAINAFVLLCAIAAYLRGEDGCSLSLISRVENLFIVISLLCVPALSIVGAIVSGAYGYNRILIFTLIAITAVFTAATISRKVVLKGLYPYLIFIIALSLTYHSALVSERMVSFGSDVGGEVFAQKIVEKNAYWNPVSPYPWDQSVGRTYAMLSVTLLPTIYSVLLDLDVVLVFKLLYAVFLALVPLGLYNLWKNFVGEKFAFISAFFFMAFQPFYTELLGLNKQILGELFLVLLLTTILSEGEGRLQRTVCLILFSFGLIVSHYALAEIFLFFSLFVLAFSMITRKPSKKVTVTFVLLFSAMMFAWYLFTSSSAVFESFMSFGERVIHELQDFFSLESREPEVLRGLGLEPPPTIWNMMSRMFAYATQALIVIGFASIILKKSRIILDKDYFLLVFCSMLFLGALIVVPGLSSTMNMTRFYHILLFFLAPLCVLGAETIINVASKKNNETKVLILLLTVLVPYFLFQTSFVYEVTGNESWSIPLSKYRMNPLKLHKLGYTDIYGISSSRWLSISVDVRRTHVYCDPFSWDYLRAYGGIYSGYVDSLSKVLPLGVGGLAYLSSLSVIEGDYVALHSTWNVSELRFLNEM
ncbi:MAG: DUF2206 domain-containing protein, partial [Candidatus Bathyarchaeia archaeon]